MKNITIVQGVPARGLLKARNKILGITETIVTVDDDFSIGSLDGLDNLRTLNDKHDIKYNLRLNLWQEIWKSQFWYVTTEYDKYLLDQQIKSHCNLLLSISTANTITVWVSRNVHDELMLKMIAYNMSKKANLFVVNVNEIDTENRHSVAHFSPEEIIDAEIRGYLKPQQIDKMGVDLLKSQWKIWRLKGKGFRDFNDKGYITEYTVNHLDCLFLTTIIKLKNESTNTIICEILKYSPTLNPLFIYWRLSILSNLKLITLTSTSQAGDENYPSPPKISLPRRPIHR